MYYVEFIMEEPFVHAGSSVNWKAKRFLTKVLIVPPSKDLVVDLEGECWRIVGVTLHANTGSFSAHVRRDNE